MGYLIDEFSNSMIEHGIKPPKEIHADGELHSFSTNGRQSDKAGRYVLHDDPIRPYGWFKDWRTGVEVRWCGELKKSLTPVEHLDFQKRMDEMHHRRQADELCRNAKAALIAERMWQKAKRATNDNAYLQRKKIDSHGIRQRNGVLIVPVFIGGKIATLQFIKSDGTKNFLTGGKVCGGYYSIGKPKNIICVVEGVATGASIHQATGHAVAIAFHAGNLLAVSQYLRVKFPTIEIIVCADDDQETIGNPGLTKATEAANAVGGLLAVPEFGKNRPQKVSDFNDLAVYKSLEAVKECIDKAKAPAVGDKLSDDWPDPQPLVSKDQFYPYPIDSLPEIIRAAILEVIAFVKCPLVLGACSALSALALVGQNFVDVERAEKLTGPTSLFLMAIAGSGERKTSCDNHFFSFLREWELLQREIHKPQQASYKAEVNAWNAKIDGLKFKIKKLIQEGESTIELEDDLKDLELRKPKPIRIPRLIYGDSTPEALGWNLHNGYPSGGVISSEAGNVLGSNGMKTESVMSNFALLNVLWDGGTHTVDRKSTESYQLKGRLTMGLAVQPDTLRSFFDATKGLARGIGFMARFLIAWPESTQGDRLFSEAPTDWPALTMFQNHLKALLNNFPQVDDKGEIQVDVLKFSATAKQYWILFHDDCERELKIGGDMAYARDVASKAADNVARLSALFHLFEHGQSGEISESHVISAARIVTWHLYESLKFLDEIFMPEEHLNVIKLNDWLINYAKVKGVSMMSKHTIQNRGPSSLRKRKLALNQALEYLIEAFHLRVIKTKNKQEYQINPKILEK